MVSNLEHNQPISDTIIAAGQSYIYHCKVGRMCQWVNVNHLLSFGPLGQVFLHKSKGLSIQTVTQFVFVQNTPSSSTYSFDLIVNAPMGSYHLLSVFLMMKTIPTYATHSSAFPSSPSHAPVIRGGGHPLPSSTSSVTRSQPRSRKPVLSGQISETNSIASSIKPFDGTTSGLTHHAPKIVAHLEPSVIVPPIVELLVAALEGLLEGSFELVAQSLISLGLLDIGLNHQHDICLRSDNVSGLAYKLTRDQLYHHGTILINSNQLQLKDFLNPTQISLLL
ncbi:uncharacterized protein MELLADRAFT_87863 [Melampsora larici-populina 98AG31]|uniref:Putative lipoate-protein ligase A n=1 Tax=Melampsora larici-populina (strain 98AG31 / pathotype 3-4-7) TaxID=747676 RepID=F4RPS7_MELLP|nr:uncharacterized protein MELLADRAFT_87863 [Melampsora larici-populina 98AG31]EGG05599.1 hypothetical protein MELLADRAFT_87863 [Melampsora larici-populina 98AG31]